MSVFFGVISLVIPSVDYPSNLVEGLIEEMPMCALRERPAFCATSGKVAKCSNGVAGHALWKMHLYNQVSTGQ